MKKRKPLFELESTNYHADGAYYTPGLRKFKLLDTLLIESHLLKYVVSGFFEKPNKVSGHFGHKDRIYFFAWKIKVFF